MYRSMYVCMYTMFHTGFLVRERRKTIVLLRRGGFKPTITNRHIYNSSDSH